MTHPIDDTPQTPQEWRERAIEHYRRSRELMATYERMMAAPAYDALLPAPKLFQAEHTYKLAANLTQSAIAAGIIADAGFNQSLATFEAPETGEMS